MKIHLTIQVVEYPVMDKLMDLLITTTGGTGVITGQTNDGQITYCNC